MHTGKKKRLAKTDLLLLGCLLFAAAGSMAVAAVYTKNEGALVRITIDGSTYGVYPLSGQQDVSVGTDGNITNVLRIAGGEAKMVEADCPDQLCIHQKAVSRQNESIVCLPNKVVVQVEGDGAQDGGAGFDSFSR